MLISCLSTKGGVGKSTLASNLACCAAREGLSVLIVDGDQQQSSLYWRGIRAEENLFGGIQVVGMPTKAIHKDLPHISASYDVTIIDCGGRDSSILRSSLIACGKGVVKDEGGIALLLVGSSQFDLWGLSDTIDALNEGLSLVDIKSYLVFNNIAFRSRAAKNTFTALSELADIPLLQARVHSRAAFKIASEHGQGVIETEPKGKAAVEIRALWQELKGINVVMKGELE
jgi:chromosome partitioning protein